MGGVSGDSETVGEEASDNLADHEHDAEDAGEDELPPGHLVHTGLTVLVAVEGAVTAGPGQRGMREVNPVGRPTDGGRGPTDVGG